MQPAHHNDPVRLRAPSLGDGFDKSKHFLESFTKASREGRQLIIDFADLAAVSSMTLGSLMYNLRAEKGKMHFENVSELVYEELKLILGEKVKDYVKGPVKKLDIQRFGAGKTD